MFSDNRPPSNATDLSGNTPLPMELNHVGVAVKSIAKALDYYVGLFGFRKVGEIRDVSSERVRVCFVESRNGVLIELVEGVGRDSPVAQLLDRPGSGPYHLCYSVPDLDVAVRDLCQQSCVLLKRFEQPALGHRRFAFLLTPDRQMFELCEPDDSVPGGFEALTRDTFRTLFFEATGSATWPARCAWPAATTARGSVRAAGNS